MDYITRLIEEVLFESKSYGDGILLVPKHPKLKRNVFRLINSLAQQNSFEETELLGETLTITWETVYKFILPEDANWDDVISGNDRHTLNRIVKTVIRKLEHALPAVANPNTKRMYDPRTGGKMFVTINFDSLDRPVYDSDGFVVGTLGDEVTESYFAPDNTYVKNPFVEWFRERRHEFLTRRQNEFIDGLSTGLLSKDTDYVDVNDFAELAGMQPNDLDHMKKRIRERTMKAWEKYRQGKPELTRRGNWLIGKIAELNEFVALVESDDDLATQNQRLSAWIKSKETEYTEDVTDFIYDALASDLTMTKAFANFMKDETETIAGLVLYRIYEAIEMEIERLKRELAGLSTTVEPRPIDYEKRIRNEERKRKYEEFKKVQPCYVYDAEGELIRTIRSTTKEYRIVNLNTYGIMHDIRD